MGKSEQVKHGSGIEAIVERSRPTRAALISLRILCHSALGMCGRHCTALRCLGVVDLQLGTTSTPPGPAAGEIRTKTVSWRDPHATASDGRDRSGLEFLTAWMREETSGAPIGELMNFRLFAVEAGEVVFACAAPGLAAR
ncbi:hypothetical protein GL303_08545 [Nocardia seriolae]|uniref:hypothetical protein n=1 Tax=Nocardia seriolae TaxID=37332 RepID=UPI0011C49B3C|nr:hypothetical protein [Nocardia seriolae]MTK46644.1 hypothetical protein [Nocardia seriolae]